MSITTNPRDNLIRPEDSIPEILQRYPHVRCVLDRYGLSGCGGASGPQESLRFFARMHGAEEAALMEELNREAGRPPVFRMLQPQPAARPEPEVWRPFFLSAILVTLTAGATWGAALLLSIARNRDFTSASLHWVNAHGHAQIFGWVGLFVMGFAYQAFPRFRQTTLWRPSWAVASLWLMLGGIVLRVVGETFLRDEGMLVLGVAGGLAEIAAALLFVANIIGTRRKSPNIPRQPMDFYLLSALVWFVAQSVFDTLYFASTVTAPNGDVLVHRVATFQSPLRDWQIFGFAMLMILGVSQRFIPGMLDRPLANSGRAQRWLLPINLGILFTSLGFGLAMGTWNYAWMGLSYLGKVLVAVGVVRVTLGWGLFQPGSQGGRSLKYLRLSHFWLYLCLAMGVLSPFYMAISGHTFSHAYYGAARHAITVGFISLTILGVAAKAVPTLAGRAAETMGNLWMPFALLNLGCAIRVFGQIATDFTPVAFPITGVSGILEVTALTLWALHLSPFLLPRIPQALRWSAAVR